MSGRGRYRGNRNRGNHQNPTLSSVARDAAASLPADSPVLAIFRDAALKLNDRQDRHERLVKLSRDVTIESKRIIFLLHSAIRKEDHSKIIEEASERIKKLIQGPIKTIGLELENSPAYLHSRAVSPGFQEFIEAYTLYSLMKSKELITCSEVQSQFVFSIIEKNEEDEKQRTVTTLLTQSDFMLGIADLTGELMRLTINSISSGDSEECYHSCQAVRDLFTGFLGLHGINKMLARKLSVTRANVSKVESAVYALRVRGDELPPKLWVPAPNEWEQTSQHSEDEGYF